MAAGLSILFFVDDKNPGLILPFFVGCCRFGVSGAFVGVWVNQAKMFPTLFVATSFGISNIFARFFVIASPMIAEVTYPIPILAFTGFAVLAGASTLFLVEIESDKD